MNTGEKMVSLLGEDHRFVEIPLETFEGLVGMGTLSLGSRKLSSNLAPSGLLSASEGALRVANSRFDIRDGISIKNLNREGQSISERTIRRWVAKYQRAKQYGSGYLGLLPKTSQRGNRSSKLSEECRTLMNKAIEENYETLKQKTKFAVWATLLRIVKRTESQHQVMRHSCLAAAPGF